MSTSWFSRFPRPMRFGVLAMLAGLTAPALAQSPENKANTVTLEPINVIAVDLVPQQIAAPLSTVSGDEIIKQGATTLGAALNDLLGVTVDSFGGGAGRPVIRGQTAPRVKVLSSGLGVLDASDISPDHAVTVSPLLAKQIEVLRGPATLLYGGGAIGGVVNVVDNKIPRRFPEGGLDGEIALRANTVADGKLITAEFSQLLGSHLVLHVQGAWRDAGNYNVPELDHPEVKGSFAESTRGSVGLSWITESGYFGVSYTHREDYYGLPAHSHEFAGCHPHGARLHCGGHGHHHHHHHGHEHGHHHGHHHHHGVPVIDLTSERIQVRGALFDPFPGFTQIRFHASYTDYVHHEKEGGTVITTFANEGVQARVELEHAPIGGLTGVLGIQYSNTTSSSEGEEAFMPTVETESAALFVVEHYQLNKQWRFKFGARHGWVEHDPVVGHGSNRVYEASINAFSGAAIWSFRPDWSLTLTVARSQRLPHPQELYADGIHLATSTYECGLLPSAYTCGGAANNESIEPETSLNYELRLENTAGRVTFTLSAYLNSISDYIYARTLDRHERFRLIKYSQRDAQFHGFEGKVTYDLTKALSLTTFASVVKAEFEGGADVPRIPAARYGGRLKYTSGPLEAELEVYHVSDQEDVASFESPTPGYNMVNLTLTYHLPDNQTSLYLHGSNLLNELARNHASYLADRVPLPGRNLTFGIIYEF